MGTIKNRIGMDLTEAEDIKEKWQEYKLYNFSRYTVCVAFWLESNMLTPKIHILLYAEDLYKKDLHDPDNHNGVITHLEPDILECEVKWALDASLWKKLVEVMEFQWSYFESWKMTLWKCYIQYASKFGKLSSGHRTRKVSLHSNPKERQCQRMLKLPHNCIHLTC